MRDLLLRLGKWLFAIGLFFFMWSPPATADTITVATTRSGQGANDSIDWGQLAAGPLQSGTTATVTNPSNFLTTNGLGGVVSQLSGGFVRVDQNSQLSWGGWNGNFTPGDHLLWTQGGGPLTLTFGSPVLGAGAQIETCAFTRSCVTTPFTAVLSAYSPSNVLLGSFVESGVSQPTFDGSAIYLGVLDSASNIGSITFSIQGTGDFAIDPVSVTTVPEPATVTLLSLGLASLGLPLLRRRRVVGTL